MPKILQEVFHFHPLHEPPWGCWTAKKGAASEDITFWVKRRSLSTAMSTSGKRIYGADPDEEKTYELVARSDGQQS